MPQENQLDKGYSVRQPNAIILQPSNFIYGCDIINLVAVVKYVGRHCTFLYLAQNVFSADLFISDLKSFFRVHFNIVTFLHRGHYRNRRKIINIQILLIGNSLMFNLTISLALETKFPRYFEDDLILHMHSTLVYLRLPLNIQDRINPGSPCRSPSRSIVKRGSSCNSMWKLLRLIQEFHAGLPASPSWREGVAVMQCEHSLGGDYIKYDQKFRYEAKVMPK